MDFKFTDEQEFFRKTVADTVAKVLAPHAEKMDEQDEFDEELWKEFSKLGYYGLRYPEELGGMNADKVTSMIFYEEMARGPFGFAAIVAMQCLMGTHFLNRFGSDAIKERCLLPAIRGEKIATICFTEEQSGSDLGATRTTAVRDGNEWVINGSKMWISNGPIADFATVVCTTDPALGLKGINFFLVEKGTPGFSYGQRLHKLGARGSVTGELIFEDVRVPAENLLGVELGKGVVYLGEILSEIRCMTGALGIGLAREAMAEGLEYARKRIAFGKPIGKYQLIREKFAQVATELEAAKLLVYKCAWMMDEGIDCIQEAAMAKLFATDMCLRAVDETTRIYGANGFAMEYPAQRYLRDARFLLYGGGTQEILRNFIGSRIVGRLKK
jgi:alkylation response protein AidB-like acyl-CoA dehydrogenase